MSAAKPGMDVGEIFLTAFLQVLFDRLASREFLSLIFREGIRKKLEKWRQTFSAIQLVLHDAEEKQITDMAVKIWLDDLRDLAFDLEDLLDDFAIEDLQRKFKAENQASTSKVRSLIPASLSGFSLHAMKYDLRMDSKINSITGRLKQICERKDTFGLKDGGLCRRTWRRPSSTCVPYGPAIGRDRDIEKILELLLRKEPTDVNFHVISIAGMAGVGKTTLARLVFNDDSVEHFDLKAWVCVSDDFDVCRITKAILESITAHPCNLKELNDVQVKLDYELEGKKFLFVLDDLWNEDYGLWEALQPPFRAGALGSKIIVTTRNTNVGKMMGAAESHNLEFISEEDCWDIFTQHALMNGSSDTSTDLGIIRKKIVERCSGLPLTARTLGALLRGKGLDECEDILSSNMWRSPCKETDILPVLRLSYHHLPHHLKRCFAYCSVFPKDYEFEEKQLVLLWMAEGLIHQGERSRSMEDLGAEYFSDLLSRSLFQESSSDKSKFVMHDLTSDLSQWVAGTSYFSLGSNLEHEERWKISRKVRHLSYVVSRYDGKEKFETISDFEHLRTFLPLMPRHLGYCYMSYYIIFHLLPKLRSLRVLSLSGYRITDIPSSIGDLKHLRYLDLSCTHLRSLPDSVCSLYNLQTLLLNDCPFLKSLPAEFGYLINLRHLNISGTKLLEGMPSGIGRLSSLQTMSDFVVGKGSFSGIGELGPLLYLQGTLCISKLENVLEAQDARDANFTNKQGLLELEMEWSSGFAEAQDGQLQLEVLKMLKPNVKLTRLTIRCYGGDEFPTWVGDPSFSNIVLLRIEDCVNCTFLPPVGQLPLLKDLLIKGMTRVESIGPEFYGGSSSRPFQSLERLRFENMPTWEDWIPPRGDQFASLCELSIIRCPQLVGQLPNHLPKVRKVVIQGCGNLMVSVLNCPRLSTLVVEGCKIMDCGNPVDFGSPNSIVLSKISEFSFETARLMRGLSKVQYLKIVGCHELTTLWEKMPLGLQNFRFLRELYIEDCPTLVSFPQSGFASMLKVIRIRNCNRLKSLLPRGMMLGSNDTCLEQLFVARCDAMKCFATGQLPLTLKWLEVSHCKNLQCLLDEGEGPSSGMPREDNCSRTTLLQHLDIKSCPSLKSLSSSGELPTTLTHLLIRECSELVRISSSGNLPAALKHLEIHSSPMLELIAEGLHHNTSLECVKIFNCRSLKTLPQGLHKLGQLRQIQIYRCPNISSFPEEGLPTDLRVLRLYNCKNLMALPNCMNSLTSLRELEIRCCPEIQSFSDGGLPTNLKTLVLEDLKFYKPMFEFGLQRLTSLVKLSIQGGYPDLVSFPVDKKNGTMMLPTSLSILSIGHFPNLESLSSKGFESLTSLNQLKLSTCPKIISLPKEGLPPSLLQLDINGCPLLSERCKKDRQELWSKIAHIPCVVVDNRFMHDTEHN